MAEPIDRLELMENLADLIFDVPNDDYLKGVADAMRIISEMPTCFNWINCDYKLPQEIFLEDGWVEPSEPVLVLTDYGAYKVSRYWGHRLSRLSKEKSLKSLDWIDLEDYDQDRVVAWTEIIPKGELNVLYRATNSTKDASK